MTQSTKIPVDIGSLTEPGEILLFEVTEDLLQEFQQDERFWFSGDLNEETVLCTSNKTFLVKEAPSSNTFLILKDIPSFKEYPNPLNVYSLCKGHYELRPHPPVFEKLLSTLIEFDILQYGLSLSPKPHQDVETEPEVDSLIETIQASPLELQEELKRIEAVYFQGQWTTLSLRTKTELYKSMINNVVIEGWTHQRVPYKSLVDKVSRDFPKAIVSRIVIYNSEPCEDDSNYVSLNIERLASHLGKQLLQSRTSFDVESFQQEWKDLIPFDCTLTLTLLTGFYVIENDQIAFFSMETLSHDPMTRMNQIFSKKKQWRLVEIAPYLKGILKQGQTEESLLLKFTRSIVTKEGEKVYVERS